ncbi:MAG: metal ABC transporter substrate-binding protein [Kineosporiaceae bacterium]
MAPRTLRTASSRRARRTAALLPALLLASLALPGCSSGTGGSDDGRLDVVASFYPLQYVTERLGGDRVRVVNLTRPGAEPHDLELSPRDTAALADADLSVYLKGFQPAVDDAVAAQAGDKALDVTAAARLDLRLDEHGEEGEHDGAGHEAGLEAAGTDPHFWLDPTRLRAVAGVVRDGLIAADPEIRSVVEANDAALAEDLDDLDTAFRDGLSRCASKDLVTSHTAFGYLAARYGLTQLGIAGLSPEAEPDAATQARVADFVREHRVGTIYYETLVSPDVARTVARETGARTAVLDPIEGLGDASAARDYLGLMRANLAALKAGQSCP